MNKISVCFQGYLPEPYGGGLTYCYQLCRELVNLNVNLYFVDTTYSQNKYIPAGIKYYKMLNRSIIARGLNFLFVLKSLLKRPRLLCNVLRLCGEFRKYLKLREMLQIMEVLNEMLTVCLQEKIDIIHIIHAYPKSLSAIILGQYLKIPVVVTIFGSSFTMYPNTERLPVAKFICDKADKVIAISKHTAKCASEAGVARDIQIIYCGIDSEEYQPNPSMEMLQAVKKKYSIKNEKVVLYVGWLIKRKGPHVLLESIPYINYSDDIKILFVGQDHGFLAELQMMVKEMALTNVLFLTGVSNDELKILYCLADIFVFPTITRDEGFGIVAVEAMACETSVVGSRIAAIPEVVLDGETGLLFDPGNPGDLAEKINMLLDDESTRKTMGRNGRAWIKSRFRWENAALEVRKTYQECISAYVIRLKVLVKLDT